MSLYALTRRAVSGYASMLSETDQVPRYATPLLMFARSALLKSILRLRSSLVRDGSIIDMYNNDVGMRFMK